MRLPIALALGWPDRVANAAVANDWSQRSRWDFEPLDTDAFPAVSLARAAGEAGRTAPAVYNGANEACVAAFREGQLPFLGIVDTVGDVLAEHLAQLADSDNLDTGLTLDDVRAADQWARARAREIVEVIQ